MQNEILANEMLRKEMYLTDGGIETTLIFHNGIDLPEFAAFPLLADEAGRETLIEYYERYIQIAAQSDVGFILESPTWRASAKWAQLLGYNRDDVARFNAMAIDLLKVLKARHESPSMPMLISGCIGPQDDGYSPAERMSAKEAELYHQHQIKALVEAGADMVTAITMTYPEEAIGIVNAAKKAGVPAVIGFTVETDGRLPVGTPLPEAIEMVDSEAAGGPSYYMLNCAHPDHFDLTSNAWLDRIGGVRANASRMSHLELDESETLDDGDPEEFGTLHADLKSKLKNLRVIGGCCGTDHRHVGCAAKLCT